MGRQVFSASVIARPGAFTYQPPLVSVTRGAFVHFPLQAAAFV